MDGDILNEKVEEIPEETEGIGEDEVEEKEELIDGESKDFYQINETYKISRDSRQYILKRKAMRQERTGSLKEWWGNVGYFPNLSSLYHHLVDLRIRETSLNDLKAVYEEVKKLHEEINREYPQE